MWVVDYMGGGDRHMSAEELDGSAKEPSDVRYPSLSKVV